MKNWILLVLVAGFCPGLPANDELKKHCAVVVAALNRGEIDAQTREDLAAALRTPVAAPVTVEPRGSAVSLGELKAVPWAYTSDKGERRHRTDRLREFEGTLPTDLRVGETDLSRYLSDDRQKVTVKTVDGKIVGYSVVGRTGSVIREVVHPNYRSGQAPSEDPVPIVAKKNEEPLKPRILDNAFLFELKREELTEAFAMHHPQSFQKWTWDDIVSGGRNNPPGTKLDGWKTVVGDKMAGGVVVRTAKGSAEMEVLKFFLPSSGAASVVKTTLDKLCSKYKGGKVKRVVMHVSADDIEVRGVMEQLGIKGMAYVNADKQSQKYFEYVLAESVLIDPNRPQFGQALTPTWDKR